MTQRRESHLRRVAACVGENFLVVDVSYVGKSIPRRVFPYVPVDVVRDVVVTFPDVGKGFRRRIATSRKLLFFVVRHESLCKTRI